MTWWTGVGTAVENSVARCLPGVPLRTFLIVLTKFTCSTLLVLLSMMRWMRLRPSELCLRRLTTCLGALMMIRMLCCSVVSRGLQFRLLQTGSMRKLPRRVVQCRKVLVIRTVSLCAGVSISVRACVRDRLMWVRTGNVKVVAPLALARVRFSRLWLVSSSGTAVVRTGDGDLQLILVSMWISALGRLSL